MNQDPMNQGYNPQYQQYPQQPQFPRQPQFPAQQFAQQQIPPPQPPLGPNARFSRRRIVVSVVGGLILLMIGAGIGNSGSSDQKPQAAPGATVTVAAPTVTVTVGASVKAAAARTAKPSPASGSAPGSNVLITFSGSGIRNSQPFVVNSSTVTAKYSFDCSAYGGSGNFIADLVSGSPSTASYDDQSIANDLSASGGQTTTIYPQNQGAEYHLEVNSECSWSITLTNG